MEMEQLRNFIKNHPDIIINKNEISIPRECRDEFYALFDDARKSFVEKRLPSLPVDASTLSEKYMQIEKDIIERLGVERIDIPIDLHSFLHNPEEGLIRSIYGRLFELLQGKIADEEFETLAESDLHWAALELYRLGYEMWASLTVIKLLDPDKAFFVDLDLDYKPVLADLKEIAFGRQAHHPTIRIPEFVLHSRRLDKFVAVKMALAREVETFVVPFTPPVRPKKKTGDTSHALDSRVMLLYFMSERDEIPIVAEIYDRKLTSPDLMIEFLMADEMSSPAVMEDIRRRVQVMNPASGMCLFVIDPAAEGRVEPIAENIQAVSAGFDPAKMETVFQRLA